MGRVADEIGVDSDLCRARIMYTSSSTVESGTVGDWASAEIVTEVAVIGDNATVEPFSGGDVAFDAADGDVTKSPLKLNCRGFEVRVGEVS